MFKTFYEGIRSRKRLCLLITGFLMCCVLLRIHYQETELPLEKFILHEEEALHIEKIIRNYSFVGTENSKKTPLLVLFTTMQLIKGKEVIYENTLRLWPNLKPAVLPVLIVTNLSAEWQKKAKDYGWEMFESKHTFGSLPVIRHMWLDMIDKYQGTFYGYANADVLFDESLVLTLQMLLDKNIIKKDPFVIGRRTNYKLGPNEHFYDFKDLRYAMSKSSAKLFIKDAQDYFITTRNGYPWRDIPDFVIGRIGYDNWLVKHALMHYYYVVDATSTVTCLHQSDSSGNFAGFQHTFLQDLNKQLAGSKFTFTLGKTDCAKIETVYSKDDRTSITRNGTNALTLRIRTPNPCTDLYREVAVDVNRI